MLSEMLGKLFSRDGLGAAGAFLDGLNEQRGPVRAVLDELSSWATELAHNAIMKWAPRVVAGQSCGIVEGCEATGLVMCDRCGKPSCLFHCRFDVHGDGTCGRCLFGAEEAPRPKGGRAKKVAKAPQDELGDAFKVLGLPKTATWNDVHARYRKLAFENAPDRTTDKVEQEKRTARMKLVNKAYEILRAAIGGKAA